MNNYTVYKHTSPSGKIYIGITKINPLRRWRPDGSGYKDNSYFWNAIQKYGWDNIVHEIVSSGLSKEAACSLEIELIKQYKANDFRYGYNRSSGGISPAQGVKQSDLTKSKRSDALSGRTMSKEHREKISKAKKGKSNGKEGLTGKASGNAKHILQLDMDNNVVGEFYGAFEAGRKLGIASPQKIGDVCRGKRKTAYGYKWKYMEDN